MLTFNFALTFVNGSNKTLQKGMVEKRTFGNMKAFPSYKVYTAQYLQVVCSGWVVVEHSLQTGPGAWAPAGLDSLTILVDVPWGKSVL